MLKTYHVFLQIKMFDLLSGTRDQYNCKLEINMLYENISIPRSDITIYIYLFTIIIQLPLYTTKSNRKLFGISFFFIFDKLFIGQLSVNKSFVEG